LLRRCGAVRLGLALLVGHQAIELGALGLDLALPALVLLVLVRGEVAILARREVGQVGHLLPGGLALLDEGVDALLDGHMGYSPSLQTGQNGRANPSPGPGIGIRWLCAVARIGAGVRP
jgi:hypothetical protein